MDFHDRHVAFCHLLWRQSSSELFFIIKKLPVSLSAYKVWLQPLAVPSSNGDHDTCAGLKSLTQMDRVVNVYLPCGAMHNFFHWVAQYKSLRKNRGTSNKTAALFFDSQMHRFSMQHVIWPFSSQWREKSWVAGTVLFERWLLLRRAKSPVEMGCDVPSATHNDRCCRIPHQSTLHTPSATPSTSSDLSHISTLWIQCPKAVPSLTPHPKDPHMPYLRFLNFIKFVCH